MHDSFKALLPMIIPLGVSDYFALSSHKKDATGIHIYLEELNLVPSEYHNNKLLSKGFFYEVILQDFPIRGQEVYPHVKRRRWLNQDTSPKILNECVMWNNRRNSIEKEIRFIATYGVRYFITI